MTISVHCSHVSRQLGPAAGKSRRTGKFTTIISFKPYVQAPFAFSVYDCNRTLTFAQLGPSQHDAAQAASEMQLSEFERCRKNCARLALDTRKAIKDRDELLNRGIKSTDTIKLSSVSRQKLAALRAEAVKMDSLYQAERKKVRGLGCGRLFI